jgi:hypothetical protein
VFIIGLAFVGMCFVAYLINKQYEIDQEDPDWRQ